MITRPPIILHKLPQFVAMGKGQALHFFFLMPLTLIMPIFDKNRIGHEPCNVSKILINKALSTADIYPSIVYGVDF